MRYNSVAKIAIRSGAMLAAALLLAGCFDVDFNVNIKRDGSGSIAVKMALGPQLTEAVKGEKMDGRKGLLAPHNPGTAVTTAIVDGRRVVTETLRFAKLSDVTMETMTLEVIDRGPGPFGVKLSRVRLAPSNSRPGSTPTPSGTISADVFRGYHYGMTMHLPCIVAKATPTDRDGKKLDLKVENSMANGATVEWKMPLVLMDASAPAFEIECWSWHGIVPGKTKAK